MYHLIWLIRESGCVAEKLTQKAFIFNAILFNQKRPKKEQAAFSVF